MTSCYLPSAKLLWNRPGLRFEKQLQTLVDPEDTGQYNRVIETGEYAPGDTPSNVQRAFAFALSKELVAKHPLMGERQMAVFDSGCSAGLVYGDFVDFSAPDLSDAHLIKVRCYHATQSDTLLAYFLHDGPIIPSSIILRREIIEDVGQFNEAYRTGEDTDFVLRVAERGTFQYVADAYVYKRRHGANLTRRLDAILPTGEHLTQEWIVRRPEFAPFARRRMARIYAKAGNDCVALGEKRLAASFLFRAILFHPLSWRIYVYFFLCALPRGVEPSVRRAAKQLFYRGRACG